MKQWGVGVVIVAFALVLGGPLVSPVWHRERHLWSLAALQNRFAAGDAEVINDVLALVDGSQGIDPTAAHVAIVMLLESKANDEALRLSRMLVHEAPPEQLSLSQPLGRLHLDVLERNGRFSEAMDWIKIHADPQLADRPESLNRLAYARALADRERILALESIERAIRQEEAIPLVGLPARLDVIAMLAAALLARSEEEQTEMAAVLDLAVEAFDADVEAVSLGPSQTTGDPPRTGHPELSLLLTTRAKLFERLGRSEASIADRRRAAALGIEASLILQTIPDNDVLMALVQNVAALLDTRGFVRYRIFQGGAGFAEPFVDEASRIEAMLADLDAAVLAATTFHDHLAEYPTLVSSPYVDAESFAREKVLAARMLAAILQHRARANLANNDPDAAAADLARITALGLDPEEEYY